MNKPFDAAEAKRMIAAGQSLTQVARFYGTTVTTLHGWIDPAYAMHTRERINRTRMYKREMPAGAEVNYKPPRAEDVAARLAEIPPDTRSLTQRLMGDPLVGRRALDFWKAPK